MESLHVLDCMLSRIFKNVDALQTHSLVNLHQRIQSTDEVLSKMVEMLTGYQTTLSRISQEIQVLQDQSQNMNLKLEIRNVRL